MLLGSQNSFMPPLDRKEVGMIPLWTQTLTPLRLSLTSQKQTATKEGVKPIKQFLCFQHPQFLHLTLKAQHMRLYGCTSLPVCEGHSDPHRRQSLSRICQQPVFPNGVNVFSPSHGLAEHSTHGATATSYKSNTEISCTIAVFNFTSLATRKFKLIWKQGRVICKTFSESSPFCAGPVYKNV